MSSPTGPVTKAACIAILAVSVIFTFTQRRYGFGALELIFNADAVLKQGQLWRLVTYPFVETETFYLLLSVVVLFLLGRSFEQQWGSRAYARFLALSAVGAAVIAVPLSKLIDAVMPFNDAGLAMGPDAAIDALLVALAVSAPNSTVMLSFVVPVRAKTIVLFVLGFQIIAGIQQGVASLSITLGGMLMGYLLTTGMWRPERFLARMKLWRLKRKRRGLYVVPPRTDHTLH